MCVCASEARSACFISTQPPRLLSLSLVQVPPSHSPAAVHSRLPGGSHQGRQPALRLYYETIGIAERKINPTVPPTALEPRFGDLFGLITIRAQQPSTGLTGKELNSLSAFFIPELTSWLEHRVWLYLTFITQKKTRCVRDGSGCVEK